MLSSKLTLSAVFSVLALFQVIAQPAPPPKGTPKVIIIQNGDTTILEDGKMPRSLDKLPKGLPNNLMKDFQDFNLDEMMPPGNFTPENKALLGVVTENNEKGACIKEVTKGSAAEKAGLQPEDIITSINGVSIQTAANLSTEVGKYQPDETIQISYLRNGKSEKTSATLTKNQQKNIRMYRFNMPSDREGDNSFRMLPPDIELGGMPAIRRLRLGVSVEELESGKGVKVTAITENSPAAKAGLQQNDILLSANGTPLTDVNDVRKLLGNSKEGDKWKIEYERAGKKSSTEVFFPKKLKTADL